MLRFESLLAWRHLLAGGWQTALIMAGVAMAVMLVVFVSGLIYGLQRRIINTILGTTSQVTVTTPELLPFVPSTVGGAPIITERVRRPQLQRGLEQWVTLEKELAALPHVRAVAPEVSGQAIATHAGTDEAVAVFGVIPAAQDQITRVSDHMLSGDFLRLTLGETIIDYELARTLGVQVGDRVRLTSGLGNNATFRISGIFFAERGIGGGDTVYIALRDAQALFNTGTSVTDFAIALDDIYAADAVADQIEASFQVEAKSWMREIPQLMQAFRAQSAVSRLISVFSLLAAGFAIASVLIVSVLKRSREIGILKAMGAHDRQVLWVFILEGLGIAITGALIGALGGAGLILAVRQIQQPPPAPGIAPEPLLPGLVSPQIVITAIIAAILITVVASALPARSAAKVNPVEVIQRG